MSAPFSIVVQRTGVDHKLTTGTIAVNGKVIGKTYENEALEIPPGSYVGVVRYASGKNFVQGPFGTLGHAGDFLLEVTGVNGRTNILLHGGNKPKHSTGCILLGPVSRSPSPHVGDEHPLRKLRLAFYGTDTPVQCPDKQVSITVIELLQCRE